MSQHLNHGGRRLPKYQPANVTTVTMDVTLKVVVPMNARRLAVGAGLRSFQRMLRTYAKAHPLDDIRVLGLPTITGVSNFLGD